MANEVNIVVKSKNQAGPGLKEAKDDVSKLGESAGVAGKLVGGLAASMGPMLVPAAAAGAAAGVGLGVALAGAGAAAGVFKAALTTALTTVQDNATELEGLEDKIEAYGDAAKRASEAGDHEAATAALEKQKETIAELEQALANMPPAQREATLAYRDMQGAWEGFVEKNSPSTFGMITRGTKLLGDNVGALQPLFDVGAKYAGRFFDTVERWAAGGGLTDLVDFLATQADGAFEQFGRIFGNLGTVIGNAAEASGTAGQDILTWVGDLTEKLANWSEGDGLDKFFENMNENGPGVAAALGNLAESIGTIATAMTPFAPLSIAIAGALTDIIAAVPPDVITAIVGAFIAWKIATAAQAGAMLLLGARAKVATGAMALFNLVMNANPVMLVVTAVAALVGGLILLYNKSETARNIMNTLFSQVGQAVLLLVEYWLRGMKMMVGAFLDTAQKILDTADVAFGWIPGIDGKLKKAREAFGNFRKNVDDEFDKAIDKTHEWRDNLAKMPKIAKIKGDISNLNEKLADAKRRLKDPKLTDPEKSKIRAEISQLESQVRKAKARLASVKDKTVNLMVYSTTIVSKRQASGRGVPVNATGGIPHAAEGGLPGAGSGAWAGGNTVLVGEQGPEYVDLPYGSRVIASGQTRGMMAEAARGGGGGPVVLELNSSGAAVDDLLLTILRRAIRVRGGNVQIVMGRG